MREYQKINELLSVKRKRTEKSEVKLLEETTALLKKLSNQKPPQLPESAAIYDRWPAVKRKEEEKIPMNIEFSEVFGQQNFDLKKWPT